MAGATVGTGRRAVGVDPDHLGFDILNAIEARSRKSGVDCGHAGSHTERISSNIGNGSRSERAYLTATPGREFGILDLIAPMRGREKTLGSSFHPGAGPAGAHGQERANDVFRVKTELGPKCPADIRSEGPQLGER